ncbi:RNA-binding protein Musashi like protein Rbp6 [Melipona quadrifasciata]|uniref:RNA-binding protein Musashi like protein Rbp6 n=1 Tax=Melipona quadrifasciata TaxID=166423 RepID=A0A0N0BD94_9HYME|nr:RNA-binding protein Musashi like protein Rbp6 [Melipona quadrifasciata]
MKNVLSFHIFSTIAGMEAANGAIEHDFHNALVPINGSHSGSSGRSTPNGGDPAPGKLFVGGLSWQTSSEKLREYFGMFGTVTDVLIMKDPVTQNLFPPNVTPSTLSTVIALLILWMYICVGDTSSTECIDNLKIYLRLLRKVHRAIRADIGASVFVSFDVEIKWCTGDLRSNVSALLQNSQKRERRTYISALRDSELLTNSVLRLFGKNLQHPLPFEQVHFSEKQKRDLNYPENNWNRKWTFLAFYYHVDNSETKESTSVGAIRRWPVSRFTVIRERSSLQLALILKWTKVHRVEEEELRLTKNVERERLKSMPLCVKKRKTKERRAKEDGSSKAEGKVRVGQQTCPFPLGGTDNWEQAAE